jgi:uncharacterized RDD family membrane protein YckC
MSAQPQAPLDADEFEYVGFWARVGAAMIDTVLVLIVCVPLVTFVYGRTYWTSEALLQGPADFLINWLLPAIAVVVFWIYRQATPGKIAIGARIVDAETGSKPSTRQLIVRYLGYYVSMLPLMAGIVWVAFDPRKQGWHDKLAGTVVVRPRQRGPARVDFPKQGAP